MKVNAFLAVAFTATFTIAYDANSHTGPSNTFPRLTGQQLVAMYVLPPGTHSVFDLNAAQQRDRDLAKAYLDGIHDATEGVTWCFRGKAKPHIVDSHVIQALQALPPEKLAGSAATLVIDFYRERYPCPERSRK
jgi:hypothetical protein